MDVREKVTEALGGLEQLVAKIPGYQGYKEKEMRREADKLLRERLARQFEEQRRRIPELQKQLISSGQIGFLDDLESGAMKLQFLIDRLKTASYGYAGFFDAVKVKEKQLDALYEFDNALMDDVPRVADGISKVSEAMVAKEGIAEAIANLVSTIQDINDTFSKRQDVILQAS
jgi:ATP phosphoribosyltransferase regulatory subunit HisZ